MDGRELASYLENELKRRGIRKGDFYEAVGITATAFYGWKNGAIPKRDTVAAIEKYLNVDLSGLEKSNMSMDAETADILQSIRERQDLRILLHSARDVPASSVFALISQIEKMKEDES